MAMGTVFGNYELRKLRQQNNSKKHFMLITLYVVYVPRTIEDVVKFLVEHCIFILDHIMGWLHIIPIFTVTQKLV